MFARSRSRKLLLGVLPRLILNLGWLLKHNYVKPFIRTLAPDRNYLQVYLFAVAIGFVLNAISPNHRIALAGFVDGSAQVDQQTLPRHLRQTKGRMS